VDNSADASAPRPVVILCEVSDGGALWAASELQIRGMRCDIVFASVLGAAPLIRHNIDAHGHAGVTIRFTDGRQISSDAPQPIFNRLMAAPIDRLRTNGGEDFGYAMQEVFAMHLSWLHGWPATVVNRPSPQGLCGNFRHSSGWIKLASETGFAVEPWRQTDADGPDLAWKPHRVDARAFVVEGRAVLSPDLPEEFTDPCVKLAAAAGSALMGIDFVKDEADGWRFIGASPMPVLQFGGPALIAALANALT